MNLSTYSVLLFTISCINAWDNGDWEKYGPFHWGLTTVSCNHSRGLNLNVSGVSVYFYDFGNNITKQFPVNRSVEGILSLPKLDKKKKLFMFVGGFKASINENIEFRVRETFKKVDNGYLIIIDHSPYTNKDAGIKLGYERSVQHVHSIGKKLAQILVGLHQGGISSKNMHCIGHSLGSHMLGHAGVYFTKTTGQNISRITALDPAGPCFQNDLIEEQVRSGAAEYVEVYHCNIHGFGTSSVLGDVDFYVNKGQSQPHCGTPKIPDFILSPIAAQCSHKQCVIMWLASVVKSDWYPAYKCDNYKQFKTNKCLKNDLITAGFRNPGKATGVYYFSTENYDFDSLNYTRNHTTSTSGGRTILAMIFVTIALICTSYFI